MAGLETRMAYSDYPSALLDRRFEDRRIGREEAQIFNKTALELALTKLQITPLTRHNSPDSMAWQAENGGTGEERMETPERRKKERRSVVDRRKSERSTGVKRRKADRRKSR
jgi:hypothetical protein